MSLIGSKENRIEVSISGHGVAADFSATAQPSFSHKYQRPQAKEYPLGLQSLTERDRKWQTLYTSLFYMLYIVCCYKTMLAALFEVKDWCPVV
jgi:hypothetical protein